MRTSQPDVWSWCKPQPCPPLHGNIEGGVHVSLPTALAVGAVQRPVHLVRRNTLALRDGG